MKVFQGKRFLFEKRNKNFYSLFEKNIFNIVAWGLANGGFL